MERVTADVSVVLINVLEWPTQKGPAKLAARGKEEAYMSVEEVSLLLGDGRGSECRGRPALKMCKQVTAR
jgi:hypothetical protein